MNPIIHIFKTPDDLADAFARQLISWVNETPDAIFHLALSGGKTPSMLFSLLAGKYVKEVPWEKIHFWWGDERMVSPDNPESNFGVVNQLLFSGIGLLPAQVHRVYGEADPEAEAERYGSEIRLFVPVSDGWPSFDLIMLGLGDDGHTASIFPGQLQLMESDKITGIANHPTTGQQRITITGKVINNAKRVAFLVTGESKAPIFDDIIHGSKSAPAYPAYQIHPVGELHWFGDEASLKGKI